VCACGRDAGDVKLWDSLSGNSIQTLKHPSAVNCLQVRDYNVVSAAKDVIYIWDMRMGRWHKLKSHTRPVLCMHYYEDNRLVLCSRACVCGVCRVVSCRVVSCRVVSCRVVSCRVVPCRVRRVCRVCPKVKVLWLAQVSGSLDTTIRVWDLSRGSEEEIGTFKGHTQGTHLPSSSRHHPGNQQRLTCVCRVAWCVCGFQA
jgi:WD40 repeat protein